jgi:AhpD family alkylhydroperoxidase
LLVALSALLTSKGEFMITRIGVLGAAVTLLIPMLAVADEARDAAVAEMESALGTIPPFIALLPEGAQAGAWDFMKGNSGNPDGEIPPKYRELIALGVAAQVPCGYCAYAHTAFAKAHGATDAEVQEAISYAAEVRLWSTILNGSQYDMSEWQTKIDGIIDHAAAVSE